MLRIAAIILFVLGIGFLVLWYHSGAPATARFVPSSNLIIPVGPEHEVSGEGFVFRNGYGIPNYPTCPLAQAFVPAEMLLGSPIGPFTGSSMTFVYGRLRCVKDGAGQATVVFDNLGFEDMGIAGLVPQPGSPASGPVREHIRNAYDMGLDLATVFGRIISPEVCDAQGQCFQYTDKQKLLYQRDAPGTTVAWTPLGCMLTQICTRQEVHTTTGRQLPLLLFGIVSLIGGLGVWVFQMRQGNRFFAEG